MNLFEKALGWILSVVLLIAIVVGVPAYVIAQTVFNKQDVAISGSATTPIINGNVFSTTNPVASAWQKVDNYGRITWKLVLTDASAGITSIDMSCQTSRVAAGTLPADMQVLTATTATGISTYVNSTWRHTSTAGGAPGTSNWTVTVTSIPEPYIRCSFLANGVITVDIDTLSVYNVAITP